MLLTVENLTRKLWPIVENESPVAKYLKNIKNRILKLNIRLINNKK